MPGLQVDGEIGEGQIDEDLEGAPDKRLTAVLSR